MDSKMDAILNPKTTDLDKLKEGKPYTWGKVIKIHEIGEYAVVEAMGDSKHETMYHSYVNGLNTSHAFHSLDAALAGCIAYKHEGSNSRAGWYFMQMNIQEML